MTVEGRCNCGNIRVVLNEAPDASVLCYCDNCRRSGGLSSVNFFLDLSAFSLQDHSGVLRKYSDKDTTSGEPAERQFCGTCGSSILTFVPAQSDSAWLKASLFDIDDIPPPKFESFEASRPRWLEKVVHA